MVAEMIAVRGWMVVALLALVAGCASEEATADAAPDWSAPVASSAMTEPVDCSDTTDDHLPEARVSRPHQYWAEDAELRAALGRVLARVNAATGLGLELEDAPGAVQVFSTDLPEDVVGYASSHIEIDVSLRGLEVDSTLLHEVGHTQGAEHLGAGEGVMSRCVDGTFALLTDADLIQICSGAPCTTFVPEYRPELAAVAR
jgi:hypothetical protein